MKNHRYRKILHLPLLLAYSFLIACHSLPDQQAQSGQCPQDRTTEYAPASVAGKLNPLLANEKNINAGEQLYFESVSAVACVKCHGENGDGNGIMANMFQPAPRNFTCSEIVSPLSDGQFFWIIKNGSIGTSMPAFKNLTDEQIWQLTLYLRSFEIKPVPAKDSQLAIRN